MMNRLSEPAESKLRSLDEIQAAHDRLVAILLGEVPNPFEDPGEAQVILLAIVDVLCWVLSHEHNQGFAENLEKIDGLLRARGYQLQRRG